jgi:hypothetical protein
LILQVKIIVTEKDLFSFAAHKHAGAHESASRKLKRSRGELNRWQRRGRAMGFVYRSGEDDCGKTTVEVVAAPSLTRENDRLVRVRAENKAAHDSASMEERLLPLCEYSSGARCRSFGHLVNRRSAQHGRHQVSGGGSAGQR